MKPIYRTNSTRSLIPLESAWSLANPPRKCPWRYSNQRGGGTVFSRPRHYYTATHCSSSSAIEGREMTVGVLDTNGTCVAFPVIEIQTPERSWYDFNHRYTEGASTHLMPAPISDTLTAQLQSAAIKAIKRWAAVIISDRLYSLRGFLCRARSQHDAWYDAHEVFIPKVQWALVCPLRACCGA